MAAKILEGRLAERISGLGKKPFTRSPLKPSERAELKGNLRLRQKAGRDLSPQQDDLMRAYASDINKIRSNERRPAARLFNFKNDTSSGPSHSDRFIMALQEATPESGHHAAALVSRQMRSTLGSPKQSSTHEGVVPARRLHVMLQYVGLPLETRKRGGTELAGLDIGGDSRRAGHYLQRYAALESHAAAGVTAALGAISGLLLESVHSASKQTLATILLDGIFDRATHPQDGDDLFSDPARLKSAMSHLAQHDSGHQWLVTAHRESPKAARLHIETALDLANAGLPLTRAGLEKLSEQNGMPLHAYGGSADFFERTHPDLLTELKSRLLVKFEGKREAARIDKVLGSLGEIAPTILGRRRVDDNDDR